MPWFRNHYVCIACDGHWLAEADTVAEADCPFCRVYAVAPYKSDDWSDSAELATSTMVRNLRRLVRDAKRPVHRAAVRARKLRRAG